MMAQSLKILSTFRKSPPVCLNKWLNYYSTTATASTDSTEGSGASSSNQPQGSTNVMYIPKKTRIIRIAKRENKKFTISHTTTPREKILSKNNFVNIIISKEKDPNSIFHGHFTKVMIKPPQKTQVTEQSFAHIIKNTDIKQNNTSLSQHSDGNKEIFANTSVIVKTVAQKYPDAHIQSEISQPSLIEIDNSQFYDAPRWMNIQKMDSFPLFNKDYIPQDVVPLPHTIDDMNSQSTSSSCIINAASNTSNITSIDMFSSGYKKVPSISKIISETMSVASRRALLTWETKMKDEMGEQGFLEYKTELLSRGQLLHECIQQQLQHHREPEQSQIASMGGLWPSVAPVLEEVSHGKVEVLESRLIHPHLHYCGALDAVAVYRNIPVLIEWKTSGKTKPTVASTFDNPLQVAAYIGALHHDPLYGKLLKVQSGLLVISYSSGTASHAHLLTPAQLQHYWQLWRQRVCQFWRNRAVATAASSVEAS